MEYEWLEIQEENFVTFLEDVAANIPFGGSPLSWIARQLKRLSNMKQPQPTGRLAQFVQGQVFQHTCTLAIAINSILIWFSTDADFEGIWTPTDEEGTRDASDFLYAESAFVLFYTVELMLKVFVHRLYFFLGEDWAWNVFDTCLVAISLGEQVSEYLGIASGEGGNMSFLRVLRMLKIVKLLRLVRTLRFFKDLRLMLNMIIRSVSALFWCLVLLFAVLYIWSVLLMQLLSIYLDDMVAGQPKAEVDRLYELYHPHFGTVRRSFISLFAATSGGQDWLDVYNLLEPGGVVLQCIFLAYILFFVLVAWNIVTGTFVEHAFRLAQPDLDTLIQDQRRETYNAGQELKVLFEDAVTDKSQSVSWEEFKEVMSQEKFRHCLEARGVSINDIEVFFKILMSVNSEASDEVNINDLINGCLSMKGFATSIDLHSLIFDCKLLRVKMTKMNGTLERMEESMRYSMEKESKSMRYSLEMAVAL